LSKGGEIVAALRDGLVAAQQWARDGINAVLDYLQSGNDQRLNGFGQALYSAGQGAIQKLGQGFQAAKEFAGGQIQQIMDDVQQRGVAFAAGAFAGRLYEAARNAMIQFGSGLLAGSPNLAGDLSRALDGLVNAFNWFMDPFKNHVFAAATDIGGRITAGLASLNGAAAIQGPLNNLVNGFNMVIEPLKNHFFSAASDLAGRIGSGLASLNGAAAIQGPLGNLGNAFNAVMDPLKAHVFAASADLGAKISAGLAAMDPAGAMRDGLWKIIDAFNYVMDGFKAHVWGVMSDIGGRISNGLAEGIRGTMQAVFDALDWIASYAPQWVKDKLGIHSPSRVFMDMGSNIMEGLAQGIEALSSAPQAALQTATAGLTDLAAGGQGGSTTVNYNRTVQTSNTFNVGGGNVGGRDPFEAVRVLNALYGQT
jgi:phage-related protein